MRGLVVSDTGVHPKPQCSGKQLQSDAGCRTASQHGKCLVLHANIWDSNAGLIIAEGPWP